MATYSETSEIRPEILFCHMLPLVGVIAWKVTNIDPCCQRQEYRSITLVSGNYKLFLDILKRFSDYCRQTGVSIVFLTSDLFYFPFIIYYHLGLFRLLSLQLFNCGMSVLSLNSYWIGLGWNRRTDELEFSRCYIFVSFGNNGDIVVHYHNNPFWISAHTKIIRMTLNGRFILKCA